MEQIADHDRTAKPEAFAFRAFQIDDLARAAMHDGLVLGWDPGLWKTGAGYIWPRLKKAARVLIVAPEHLHLQITEEGERFGITPRPLMTLGDFYDDPILREAANHPGEPIKPAARPIYWLTSYSALGFNGGDMWAPQEKESGEIIVNRNIVATRQAHPLYREEHDRGIGDEYRGMRCIFAPTLALLCAPLFDCVVCDEGVKIKSDESYWSLGVRMMQPKYRLVSTATPVKNHLESIFWLCQWACGGHAEATARWPYPNTNEAHETFANEHMLIEQNHTKEEEHKAKTGRFKSFRKRTPKICNIHRLWKLLGPVVLRRRKEHTGEKLAPKTIVPIRIKPGATQQEVYRFHLDNRPKVAKNGNPINKYAAVVAQLQLLRQAALCPDSHNLTESGLSVHGLRKFLAQVKPPSDPELTEKAVLVARKGDRTPFENERQVALTILERMITRSNGSDAGRADSDSPARTPGLDLAQIIAAAPSFAEHLQPFIVADEARNHARSWTDFNPKQAAIFKLIEQIISQGKQVVILSPFQHFSRTLYRRLLEANVSACLLDGNLNPKKRGQLARQFKRKRFAVLIGGMQSMGEGNSFECAEYLILPSLEWAFDINKQCIDRVHRLISKWPVTIYTMVTENTIDERLESVFRDKSESSDLALDGRLFSDQTDEINLGQLLQDAIHNFNPAAETIPEKDIEREWDNSLRHRLRIAEQDFRQFHPPIVPDVTGEKVTAAEVRRAFAELNRQSGSDSEIGAIVNCIPTATIGALIGTADRAKIDKARAAFTAFCIDKAATDWKRAWQAFEGTGALEKMK